MQKAAREVSCSHLPSATWRVATFLSTKHHEKKEEVIDIRRATFFTVLKKCFNTKDPMTNLSCPSKMRALTVDGWLLLWMLLLQALSSLLSLSLLYCQKNLCPQSHHWTVKQGAKDNTLF